MKWRIIERQGYKWAYIIQYKHWWWPWWVTRDTEESLPAARHTLNTFVLQRSAVRVVEEVTDEAAYVRARLTR